MVTHGAEPLYVGIDAGTSSVKIVLADGHAILAGTEEPLYPRQPRPSWSEDDAEHWWSAVVAGLDRLSAASPDLFGRVEGLGLSGQMHGALLLDADDRPVRPAILWNDGRSAAEAAELARRADLCYRTGVRPMPGFTGPKVLWLRRHEPAVLDRTRHLLLPKDYLRLKLTGERITDVSDAAGTWLLDQARRDWSGEALAACGVDADWLPGLVESTAVAGRLRPEWASRWGLKPGIPIAGGGGDTAVGGVGIGAVTEGRGFVSLGTSGQVFLATAEARPDPDRMTHAFCHALPGLWYSMAAMLNGASPLVSVARWTGCPDVATLLSEVEAGYSGPSPLMALPYLFGERTPHNDPDARGVLLGLTGSTSPADIGQAMLEAIAFSLRDGLDALVPTGARPESLGFIGGGSRSRFWGRIIASVLGITLVRYEGADRGPAFGAARLARLAVTDEDPADVATPPRIADTIAPEARLSDLYESRLERFRSLYQALKPEFQGSP